MSTPSRPSEVSDSINAMDDGNEQASKFGAITIEHNSDNNKRHWPFDNTKTVDHSDNASTHNGNDVKKNSSDKWSGGRSRSRSNSGPEHHVSYKEADLQRVDHPPSKPFLEHRQSFNASERHPVATTADGHFTAEPHIHFKEEDLKRVEHPASPEFLEHRHSHYHSEVHPPSITVDGHIHFKEADVQRVDHPPSPRFLEHRHSFDHSEVHPVATTADGHFTAEPHIHFKEADVKRVDHPPSPRFLEHRHSFDHAEVHPTADGHAEQPKK